MRNDPWEDPEIKLWYRRTQKRLPPMIRDSAITLSIVPHGDPDVKYCVELGMCIMMGKPIILIAQTNDDIPPKLRAIADEIIISTMDKDNPAEQRYVAERLQAFMEKFGPKDAPE